MKILIVTTSFPCKKLDTIGGKFVLLEAQAYARNGAKVKVVTPIFKGAPPYEKFEENLEVFRFKYFYPESLQKIVDPGNPIYDKSSLFIKVINAPFFLISFLYSVLKHSKGVQIIHCQWTVNVLFALPARWIWGSKIVVTARGSDIRLFPKWLNRFIMKTVNASIDCFGPHSWNLENKKKFPSNYIKLPIIVEKPELSEMPEDLKEIFDKNPDAFKIVYLGRLDTAKQIVNGLPILLLQEAVRILIDEGEKIILVYIGNGNLFDDLKKKNEELKLQESVFLLGSKSNVNSYIAHFDLGFGSFNFNAVAQEFTLLNIPQCYNELFSDSYFIDKENCLFFKDLESIINCIRFAMNNRTKLKSIATNCRILFSEIIETQDLAGAKYLDAFEKLLEPKHFINN